jgi:hypothetical protein
MLARIIEAAIAQIATLVRSRTKQSVKQAIEEGIKEALSELELTMEMEATVIRSTAVQMTHETHPALNEVPRLNQPEKKKPGRPRKHTEYENINTQGS